MTEFDDDALLDELADLLAADHDPPPEVLHAARESFTWRTVDAELATLVFDSLIDDEAAAMRASDRSRFLTFEVGAVTVEVEVESAPAGRRMLGQIVPPRTAELEVRRGRDVLARGTADDLGRFVLALPDGPDRVTLHCRFADGSGVESVPEVI